MADLSVWRHADFENFEVTESGRAYPPVMNSSIPPPAGVEPKSLSWQLYQFIFTGQLEVKTGLEWVGTDATSNSPIMARFWYIIDGIEIYKKRNNYANLLNCAC